jgi:hypothetical protein
MESNEEIVNLASLQLKLDLASVEHKVCPSRPITSQLERVDDPVQTALDEGDPAFVLNT